MNMLLIWIFATLAIASIATILGKKRGVEYPIAIMAALVITADILANKLVLFCGLVVPAGVIVASSTFLITDILSELWGRETSKKAVTIGLMAKIVFLISLEIAIRWQAPEFAQEKADMFHSVLGLTSRITIGSIIAYFISQYHDVFAYHYWLNKTNGRALWLRNNASTIISQFIDTVVFVVIAFYGVFPIQEMIISLFAAKVLIALLDTPFIYFVVRLIKKI